MNALVKLLLEVGPLGVFFLTFTQAPPMTIGGTEYAPIVLATGTFMIATALSLSISYIMVRKLPVMPMVSGIVVFVFGGLTIFLNDELFIKLKPTIVNGLFAAILLGGLGFGKALLKPLLEEAFPMTAEGWRTLTLRWGLFFVFLAVLNEVMWRNFSTETWVSFKTFGVMPITLIFTFAQIPLMNRSMNEAEAEAGARPRA